MTAFENPTPQVEDGGPSEHYALDVVCYLVPFPRAGTLSRSASSIHFKLRYVQDFTCLYNFCRTPRFIPNDKPEH